MLPFSVVACCDPNDAFRSEKNAFGSSRGGLDESLTAADQ